MRRAGPGRYRDRLPDHCWFSQWPRPDSISRQKFLMLVGARKDRTAASQPLPNHFRRWEAAPEHRSKCRWTGVKESPVPETPQGGIRRTDWRSIRSVGLRRRCFYLPPLPHSKVNPKVSPKRLRLRPSPSSRPAVGPAVMPSGVRTSISTPSTRDPRLAARGASLQQSRGRWIPLCRSPTSPAIWQGPVYVLRWRSRGQKSHVSLDTVLEGAKTFVLGITMPVFGSA
jgi:hypothetical protein